MTHHLWQRCLAESIGTFFIVFGTCSVVITDIARDGAVALAGIAALAGLIVFAMISALGPISGAHFNPAVTLAFAAANHLRWRNAPLYLAAQTLGGMLAVSLLHLLFDRDMLVRAQYGAHIPNTTPAAAFGFEIVYTFLLKLVIIAVATDQRVPSTVPAPAIGLTVAAAIYLGGPITGASMNPIRSLAPALFAGGPAIDALPIYLFAPLVGAILAALTYEALRKHTRSEPIES